MLWFCIGIILMPELHIFYYFLADCDFKMISNRTCQKLKCVRNTLDVAD